MRNDTGRPMFSSYQAKQVSVGVPAEWLEEEGRGIFERPSPRQEICRAASHLSFDQVVGKANAELAHLSVILSQLGCAAQLRQMEGTVRPPNWNLLLDPLAPTLCVPIYDPEGRAYASLDLTRSAGEGSEAPDKLLRVLFEWAASAITERWFRMLHHQDWIVAARHQDATDASIILAVDRDQRLVGADRRVRQLLDDRGLRIESKPALSTLFSVGSAVFKDGPGPDLVLQLRRRDDDTRYSGVITPPDPVAVESSYDERLLLHTRPRLYGLTCTGGSASREQPPRSLASHALRSILTHIDSHLDTPLNLDDLAAQARLSVSHFSRCFLKSVGVTPHSYVVRRRLQRAQQLLAHSEMNLLDVALAAGFSDQSHFCRRFRAFVGVTPRAFRARYR
jgi:AraC-like DNA-binding protein